MKRHLLLLLVALLPMLANAYDAYINGIFYNFISEEDAEVTYQGFTSCTGYYSGYSGAMTIPASVTYNDKTYSVTSIGSNAFNGCDVTSINIPNSVTSIGGRAFGDCQLLSSITIPSSVTSIGTGAFQYCGSLTSITIPSSVITIGEDAFINTPWYINQLDGLVYAGKIAYKYKGTMPSDTQISIEEGTLGIGNYAFSGCTGLTSITIPNSVTNIGYFAFDACSGLTSVTIPNSVISIGSRAFSNCRGLTSIIIGSGVTKIDNSAFSGCTGLTSITIGNKVTSIGNYAFKDCTGLTSITIPNSVTSIGYNVFEDTPWYNNQPDGLVFAGKVAYKYKGTMPSNTQISIEEGTLGIGYSAFLNCTGLTSITIPNSVISIDNQAFSGCSGLTSITIPNNVTSIGAEIFEWCESLTSICVEEGNTVFDSRNNCNAIIETATNTLIAGCKNTIIPNSVTSIGDYAFSRCWGLTTITIGNNVTSIGNGAFSYCSSLTSITLPNSVTSIRNDAFSGCTGLTSVTIPNSVTSIGDYAFSRCWGLTTITIGNNVTSIGNGAFSYCSSLTSITLPNSVTSIGNGAFSYCSSLTSITLPNSVRSIGSNAFNGCRCLTTITIGNNVTSSIGKRAFENCSGLVDVYCYSMIPNDECDQDNQYGIFNNSSFRSATLHVPAVYLDYYKGIWPWRYFGKIVLIEGTEILATNISLSQNFLSFDAANQTTALTATITPSNATNKNVTWTSSDTCVATVSDTGVVTSKGNGTAVITAKTTDGTNLTATCTVTVDIVPVIVFADAKVKAICVSQWDTNGDGELSELEAIAVTDLGMAFKDKTSITSFNELKYFTGLATIGKNAFGGCSKLTSITIPNSVGTIGSYAFEGCSNLITVTLESNNIVSVLRTSSTSMKSFFGGQVKKYVIGDNVNAIGNYAFYGCTGMTSITIPNSVTSIGESAFYFCSGLTSVTIPNRVTSIGSSAFYGCTGLTSITIPNSVTSISSYAFSRCTGLTSVTIPNSVTTIGIYAFQGCSSLASITIPNRVTSIEYRTFYGCSGLTSITIGSGVTSIVSDAFHGCNNLTDVTLDNNSLVSATRTSSTSMKSIFGEQVKKYVLGKNVLTIGDYAFYGCSGLTSITIPNSVTKIGNSAFSGCTGLTSITIPNSVTAIGDYTFQVCTSLTSVHITDLAAWCNISFGNWCSNPLTDAHHIYLNNQEIKNLVIPNDVTSIGDYAFYGCSKLTSITIPDSVTSIGDNAFRGCSGLTSITIPNSVTAIGDYAFYDCTSLTSVTIPNSVTSIGNSVFSGCKNITDVTLDNNTIVSVSRTYNTSMKSFFGRQVKKYVIGDNVNAIGNYAFYGCTGMTSITIPNSVTSIGESAFEGCSNLISVIIGSGVTSIGNNAFDDCSNLKKTTWLTNTPPSGYANVKGTINYVSNNQYTSLSNKIVYPFLSSMFEVDGIKYVPVSPSERTCDAIDCVYDEASANINISSTISYRGVTLNVQKMQPYLCYNNKFINTLNCNYSGDIASYAFYGCTNLTSAVCENQGNIGSYAFSGCTNLTNLTLGEGISSIGNNAFQYCSSLPSVSVSNSVTTLGDYAFGGCSSLANISLGNQLKTIGQYAFNGCKSLPAISIPASVNTINNYAFTDCTGLKTFIIADRENELSLGCNGSSPLFSDCPLDSVYIGGNITYNTSSSSGYSPFYRNTSLRTVVITDKETEISPNEFYGCSNLQNFTIGDGVKSFGDWAFSGCSSLKSLSFGSQLSSIGKEAFSDCTSVTKIVSRAATPPVCGDQALDDINKWNCTLLVPEGHVAEYQAALQWKEFFFMEEFDPDAIVGIKADENTEIARYDIQGHKIAKPQKGINIIRYSDGTSKKLLVK